jgi:hypothetical protein
MGQKYSAESEREPVKPAILTIVSIAILVGVHVTGLLPAPLQNFIVYGGAIPADSESSKAAQSFLAFITDADKSERWNVGGFEPVPSTQ